MAAAEDDVSPQSADSGSGMLMSFAYRSDLTEFSDRVIRVHVIGIEEHVKEGSPVLSANEHSKRALKAGSCPSSLNKNEKLHDSQLDLEMQPVDMQSVSEKKVPGEEKFLCDKLHEP